MRPMGVATRRLRALPGSNRATWISRSSVTARPAACVWTHLMVEQARLLSDAQIEALVAYVAAMP
jgi:hypothetical protein